MNIKKESVSERIARMAAGKTAAASTAPKTEKVKKGAYVKKGGNGGARENAGRKPLEEQRRAQFQVVREFADRELVIVERNTQTGKETKKKMTVLAFTLETLLTKVREKDMTAIHELLDRVLGKAMQPVGGDEDQPIVVKIDF